MSTLSIGLVDSEFLDPLPELTEVGLTEVNLTPASYVSWSACLAANTTKRRFKLAAGDYTSWGNMDISRIATSTTRVVFMYAGANADVHPMNRDTSEQALVSRITLGTSLATRTEYCIFHGLTWRPTALLTTAISIPVQYSVSNVFSWCDVDGAEFLLNGVVCRASNNTFQRCTFHDGRISPGLDSVGIKIESNGDIVLDSVKILDCEIWNWVDCIQPSTANSPGTQLTEHTNMVIDGCDLWNDDGRIAAQALENLLDIKTGTDTPNSNRITNTRFWGMGPGDGDVAGSGGSTNSFTLHEGARQWVFDGCIVGENIADDAELGASAWSESVWSSAVRPTWTPRYNTFTNGIIYQHRWALQAPLDGTFTNNLIIGCGTLFHVSEDLGRFCVVDPVVTGNTLLDVNSIFEPGDPENPPYDEEANSTSTALTLIRYQRKRFSNPEWKVIYQTESVASTGRNVPGRVSDHVPSSTILRGR